MSAKSAVKRAKRRCTKRSNKAKKKGYLQKSVNTTWRLTRLTLELLAHRELLERWVGLVQFGRCHTPCEIFVGTLLSPSCYSRAIQDWDTLPLCFHVVGMNVHLHSMPSRNGTATGQCYLIVGVFLNTFQTIFKICKCVFKKIHNIF